MTTYTHPETGWTIDGDESEFPELLDLIDTYARNAAETSIAHNYYRQSINGGTPSEALSYHVLKIGRELKAMIQANPLSEREQIDLIARYVKHRAGRYEISPASAKYILDVVEGRVVT